MKQAILITVYKDASQVVDIVRFFGKGFNFYVHVDKKSETDFADLRRFDNVFVSRRYVVNWGGLNHLKAILLLSNEALRQNDNGFFHLITGQDFPTKTGDYLESELDTSKSYLQSFDLPSQWLERLNYYNFYDLVDAKRHNGAINRLVRLQKKLRIERGQIKGLPRIFAGSTYWSLNREALQYVIDYTRSNKALTNRLRHTFCAEEIYFQSVLMNSPLSSQVVNDNLRFIDWQSGKGGRPAVLDEGDFSAIVSSNSIFARKFDAALSGSLKSLLEGYLAGNGHSDL